MSDFTGKERRSFVRISAELPLTVGFGETHLAYPAAFACDVSTGGLGVVVHGDYPDSYGDLTSHEGPVTIEVDLPGHGRLSIPAEVAWARRENVDGKEQFRLGLRFLDIGRADHEALERFVREKVFDRVFPPRGAKEDDAGK